MTEPTVPTGPTGPTGMMNDPQTLRCLLYMVVSKYGGDITVEIPPEILAASDEVDMGTLVVDEANGPNIRIYIEPPKKPNGQETSSDHR